MAADYLAGLDAAERKSASSRIDKLSKLKVPAEEVPDAHRFRFATGLGEIARGEYDPPRQIVARLILEGKVHWLSGHPGHGKSTTAAHVAVEHMAAGGHVVWLDFEAGKVPTVERLKASGATVEQLENQLHLAVSPPHTADADGFAPVAAALEDWPGSLVVFDSASKALASAGLDENNPAEVTRWTTAVVIPTREAGGTVIVIDHVTKGATKTTPYARGAGSKLADADVAWYVEAARRFDRETVGRVELTRHKDRDGLLPEAVAYEVGDGAGALPMRQVDVETEETRTRRDAGLREKVENIVRAADKPLSKTVIRDKAGKRKADVIAALDELVNDPSSGITVTVDGGHSLYTYDPDNVRALPLRGPSDETLSEAA